MNKLIKQILIEFIQNEVRYQYQYYRVGQPIGRRHL
jgi:hypothetical protein